MTLSKQEHLSEEANLLYAAGLSSTLLYWYKKWIIHRCADHSPAIIVQYLLIPFNYHQTR